MHAPRPSDEFPKKRHLLRWISFVAGLSAIILGISGSRFVVGRTPPPRSSDLPHTVPGVEASVFYTTTLSIPTYPYAAYLEPAYSTAYNMTYPTLDWARYEASNPVAVLKDYELLVLENAYLKVTVLPELGGRVYQLIDKVSGHNQLYQNPVIKPTRWGPPDQGWWLAVGGIEWCLPVDEHGYESVMPWTWSAVTSTEGVTVTVRDTQADDRLRAVIDIFLPADRAHLVVAPRLENPTLAPIDYKFWINAALAPGAANTTTEGFTFVFNSPEMSVHSTDDDRLPGYAVTPTGPDYRFSWPDYDGIDYAHLRNWQGWLGFFEYPQATKGFVGVYDEVQGEGLVRVFPPEIATGAKGFAVGWGEEALPPWLWTDDDSTGAELHGGVAPTFWDTAHLPPGGVTTWREVWYPVRDLADLSVVSADATLAVSKEGELLNFAAQPTRAWGTGETELFVWNRTTCTELAHWRLLSVSPTDGYENAVTVGDLTLDEVAAAFVTTADHTILAAYGSDDCLDYAVPAPHLGYGVNVRNLSSIQGLVEPLDFEWVKLWEEYSGLPAAPLTQNVLYNVSVGAYVNNLDGWRLRIRSVARDGEGKVQAYEIGNEPNVRNSNWGGNPPDPQRMTEMLCIAYEEIKAVDADAAVISGGLAPVGRVPTCTDPATCNVIDERDYLQAMLARGAGDCMDAFGYHPYGFAYPPERDPELVSNGFTFRGVETMREILDDAGLETMPVWATEFNWIRRPSEDGYETYCDGDQDYKDYFKWQEVSAQTQAEYLTRAFQYADTHWPWMAGMFVWNLDWHDYLTWLPCFHSRYYSLRRLDGSAFGATTPAYEALVSLDKRPGSVEPPPPTPPTLSVQPHVLALLSEIVTPHVLTTSLLISNTGTGMLTWTVGISPTSTFTPTLSAVHGGPGERLWVSVDTAGMATGRYTATMLIDAEPADVLDAHQVAEVRLHVVTEFERVYLPAILRVYAPPPLPPTPSPTAGPSPTPHTGVIPVEGDPHGPSKIGTHAIGDGGTTALVQQVHDAGGRVALVKGLSFGYLCEVKLISPETVTVGRWMDWEWETVVPEGDPAVVATAYMAVHMQHWASYKDCVDYWEVLNEVDPFTISGHEWVARFYKAAMSIADANGYRLALFSYSMGVPEIYEWAAIAETGVFAQAKAGGHILALHEYGGPLMRDRWGEAMPSYPGQDPLDPTLPRYSDRGVLAGRYRHLYRDILIPRNEVIPLAITEANLGIDDPEERADYFLEEIAWYDDRLREDDYVLGMAIFTLTGGIPGWERFDYSAYLPDLADRIISLKDE